MTDVYGDLKSLKELLDMDIITLEEFNHKKKELLDQIGKEPLNSTPSGMEKSITY